MELFVLKFYCDFFFPLTQGNSNKSWRLLWEEGPSPMYIFFFPGRTNANPNQM